MKNVRQVSLSVIEVNINVNVKQLPRVTEEQD